MYTDRFGNTYYKVALHQHTTRSDGKITPEAVAARYKAAGYDAIALTDHWVFADDKELAGLLLISGCEYNMGTNNSLDGVMHIVGVGMEQDPHLVKKCVSYQAIIDGINAAGGIALLTHPAWSLNTPEAMTVLHGFSAVEIFNTVSDAHNNFKRAYSGYAIDLCANLGMRLPLIATDDSHYYDGTDDCASFTMVRAESCTVPAILNAIRRGDCYATQGPWLSVTKVDDRILVHCSPCNTIAVLSNLAATQGRVLRGTDLTYFEYTPAANERWIRVEVQDAEGKFAWSNILSL